MWLFAARDGQRPREPSTAQQFYYVARDRAGISKRGGIHLLRHALATPRLEAGTDLPTIQRLLGPGDLRTTLRSLHLARRTVLQTTSPLEGLEHVPPTPG